MRALCTTLLIAWVAIFAVHTPCDTHEIDTLTRALREELDRSLSQLQLEDEPPPYFISYTVDETTTNIASFVLGALEDSTRNHFRRLTTVVRVGSKDLDNSNFAVLQNGQPIEENGLGHLLPIDDDYDELKRSIWIATDQAYKEAVSALSAKKAALAGQSETQHHAAFSNEEAFIYESLVPIPPSDSAEVSRIAQTLSETFRMQPEIFVSSARVVSVSNERTYLDSEGNSHKYTSEFCSARAQAKTQSESGMELSDTTSFLSRRCSDLPDDSTMRHQTMQMVERLKQKRQAEELFAYEGPVLFEAQAAAEFFNQVLFDLLGAVPLPQIGDPEFDGGVQRLVTPFLNRLNSLVFPRSFSVINDPTQTEYNNRPLLGSYVVDGEGMPSRRTELVENGRLLTLLASRSPIGSLTNSTGSNRGLPLPMPGNLFVAMEDAIPMDELKSELLEIAQSNGSRFAVIIRKISNALDVPSDHAALGQKFDASMSGEVSVLPAVHVVKVLADGSEVPVQPVRIVEFDVSYLKDIVAASDEVGHFDLPVSILGATNVLNVLTRGVEVLAGSDHIIASVVTPALLFEDLSLRSARSQRPKLPIVPHPLKIEQ